MNKILAILVIALVSIGGLVLFLKYREGMPLVTTPVTDSDLIAEKSQKAQVPAQPAAAHLIPLKKTVRLAVGSLGIVDEGQNSELADLVVAQLSSNRSLELVERQNLNAVLREQQLSFSGLIRAKDAVQVGKLLRADWFLLGTSAQIHGTNCLVIRLVDARSGITLDGVVLVRTSPTDLASETASFVRQAREEAAEAKGHKYLAIGVFQDLSVNSRQVGFPSQLRAYLTAAYQDSQFTLLEREYADALLQEMQLDLAGLSENGGIDAPTPMPSAFWLVDGVYQSYETTNVQLELALKVHRIFSTTTYVNLRSPPGEAACKDVKDSIDKIVSQNSALVVPTRASEPRSQLMAGKELLQTGCQNLLNINELGFVSTDWGLNTSPREVLNLQEAVRAFETVLLLEPTNCEAKVYLAGCLRYSGYDRMNEARSYYRQVIEDKNAGIKFNSMARFGLTSSFDQDDVSKAERASWYETAASQTSSSNAATFYLQQADDAKTNALLESGGATAQAMAAQGLLAGITNALLGNAIGRMGTEDFIGTFGPNRAAAAQKLAELYPKLKAKAPEYEAYFLTAAAIAQVDTNAPVVLDFQRMLTNLVQHPDQVTKPDKFWWHIADLVYYWSCDQKLYDVAAGVIEGKRRAARLYPGQTWGIDDDERVELGFAYLAGKHWQQALDVFETFSNSPIEMGGRGLWGPAFTVVYTKDLAATCRKKLDLPPLQDPREFDMGNACFNWDFKTFAIDTAGLWFIDDRRLIQLDFNLKTVVEDALPPEALSTATCLCVDSSGIWIGTAGGGLVEYNKQTRKFRRFGSEDGLLMDSIWSLHLNNNSLWIGYGDGTAGGLGRMDISTHHIESFSRPLSATDSADRVPTVAVVGGQADDVWFIPQYGSLRHYQPSTDAWEIVTRDSYGTSLATDGQLIAVGQTWNYEGHAQTGLLGISILDIKTKQWQRIDGVAGLPAGTVDWVTFANKNLWVGGFGYLACVDSERGFVHKYAHVRSKTVGPIQIGNGYVWAKFAGRLHRAQLNDLR